MDGSEDAAQVEEQEEGCAGGLNFLAVAEPVALSAFTSGFFQEAEAEEHNHEDTVAARRRRKEATRWAIVRFFLASVSIVVLVVVTLLAALLAGKGRNDGTKDDAISAASAPATLTLEQCALAQLPACAKNKITVSNSPQQQAFQWLLNDTATDVANYPTERVMQRFSLATLFFATNGLDWHKNTNWLSHEHHECDWHWSNRTESSFSTKCVPPESCCNDNGVLEHLWLDNNGLNSKSLPEELCLLTNLKSLNVEQNTLHGAIS